MEIKGEDKCECPKGFIPEDFKNPANIKCRKCPNGAEKCLGGNQIVVSKGFFRTDVNSGEIYECFNKEENCVGGTEVGDNLCKEGHIGSLCEGCDIENVKGNGSYGHKGPFECVKCDNMSYYWKIFFLFVF